MTLDESSLHLQVLSEVCQILISWYTVTRWHLIERPPHCTCALFGASYLLMPFRILIFEIARQVSAWDFNNDSFFLYMISEFESGLELIEVLSICFEVSSSSLRQVMDYQFPPLMGPGRRATFRKCQVQQKFSFLIRWTFKVFVAILCSGVRNSGNIMDISKNTFWIKKMKAFSFYFILRLVHGLGITLEWL